VESIEDWWKLTTSGKKGDRAKAREQLEASAELEQYSPEERQLIAAQVSPLAFGKHPIDAYNDFIEREVKVPLESMSEDDFFKRFDGKGVFIAGVIVEVKYNQIGDFHTGELPPEDVREKMFWGHRYANVNIEDPGGVQNRVKFDWDIFDEMRELIDSGIGTPVIAHVIPNERFQNLKASFAVDIEKLRKKILNGEELSVWEGIVCGKHPAKTYPWKPGKLKFTRKGERKVVERAADAVKNVRFKTDPACDVFTGLVTNAKPKFDKNDNEMAFIGLLGGDGTFIEVVCFGSTWPDIKEHITPGRLVQMSLDVKPGWGGRGKSFIFNGDKLKLLNKSSGK
jgi:hypothetical protein